MKIQLTISRMTMWLMPALALGQTSTVLAQSASDAGLRVTTRQGIVEGILESSGVRSFKGMPYAAPPVGDLRWKEPQPPASWAGVRKADHFGPRAMQPPIYSDMVFRSDGMSEDCLYLNVWAPGKKPPADGWPVMFWIYGGNLQFGGNCKYNSTLRIGQELSLSSLSNL